MEVPTIAVAPGSWMSRWSNWRRTCTSLETGQPAYQADICCVSVQGYTGSSMSLLQGPLLPVHCSISNARFGCGLHSSTTALSQFHGAGAACDRRPLHKPVPLQTPFYDYCSYIASCLCTLRTAKAADPVKRVEQMLKPVAASLLGELQELSGGIHSQI